MTNVEFELAGQFASTRASIVSSPEKAGTS
jgi:hypothetical protein